MDDKDKLDITDTFVPYDDHTSQTRQLEALGETLGRELTTNTIQLREARAWLEEVTGGTTGRHRYQPSWMQRALSWFRKN